MAILSTPSSAPAKSSTHEDKALSETVVEKGKAVEDESDTNSELKQDGVKQVEAVTQAWSPAMMWLVFVLYVYFLCRMIRMIEPQRTHTDNLSPDCTWSHS